MPVSTSINQETQRRQVASFGTQIPFGAISEPGCYISNLTGRLIRIPEDALKVGRSPVIEVVSRSPMMVTRISTDPYLSLTKARMLASDCDVMVNF